MSAKQFQNEALKSNLDLRLAEADLNQAQAEASGIRVPPAKVSLSTMQMKGAGSAQGWQVSQSLPFPTKITSDYQARQRALDSQAIDREVKVQEIKALAHYIYFYVWESQEQERILQHKEKLLKEHLNIARSVARSDTFAKVHLLKVETELDQVKNSLAMLEQVQKERMTLAAGFLDKDPSTFSFSAQDPGLSSLPQIDSLDSVPQVKSSNKQVQKFAALESAGKSEWLPDFQVSYSHMERTVMFPENNQITVGISLPFLYFWQPASRSNQASARRVGAEIELQKTKRSIQADKVNLEQTVESLKKQIDVLANSILPRSYKRKRFFQNIAPRDLSSLREHLETYLSIPNTQMEILSLKTKYEQAIAGLAKYQGLKE